MEMIKELLVTLTQVFVAIFWAMVHFFIPPARKSVKDEVVLVTGAGCGIGRLLAIELAKLDAVLVLWDINNRSNEETAGIIKEMGKRVHAYTCDVSKRKEVYKLAERVKEEVGDVNILINNAGIVNGQKFLDTEDDKIMKTFEVNVFAHFWTVKCFLPKMLEKNHGHIVDIASTAGLVGTKRLADYCASKFANVGFTESLMYEISAAGCDSVYTTTVCPFHINTGMFKGCVSKFPRLLPTLDPDATAKRIVQGILTNQRQLCIPRAIYLLSILKTLLPIDASRAIHKWSGATSLMDSFTGREKGD